MAKFTYRPTNGKSYLIEDPDPQQRERYKLAFYTRVGDLPEGVPAHGNPRKPNIDRKLYERLASSFLDPENDVFVYQHRGLIVMAETIRHLEDGSIEAEISDDPEAKGGVIDGCHSETLLLGDGPAGIRGIRDSNPDRSIFVQIYHGISERAKRTRVSVALNSQIPISNLSNLNAQGYFEGLKGALRGTPIEGRVQYEQNGPGDKIAAVAHLIELMYVMRLDLFPDNLAPTWDPSDPKPKKTKRGRHPSYVITATKQNIHEAFPDEQLKYESMYGVLPQICELYDIIESQSHRIFRRQHQKSKAFTRGRYLTTWQGLEADYVLHRYAVLPMISSFRYVLETGTDGNYQWKLPFPQVKGLFCFMAGPWINRMAKYISGIYEGGRANTILISSLQEFAKDRDAWTRMYDDLDLRYRKSEDVIRRGVRGSDLEVLND
jgi:hypothetical protein